MNSKNKERRSPKKLAEQLPTLSDLTCAKLTDIAFCIFCETNIVQTEEGLCPHCGGEDLNR